MATANATRKRSLAWDYFYKEEESTFCEICKEEVKTSGNTSNLFRHLQSNHKDEYTELEKHRLEQASQKKMKVAVKQPKESQRKKKLDDLVKMIATDLQPISIVNDQGFQDFLKAIDSKYVPPSRRTITRDLIPKIHSTCKLELAESLSKAAFCTFTTDQWTSRATQGFLTFTIHYIEEVEGVCCSKSSVLETACLKTDHTGENIATELQRIATAWTIQDKIVCAVTHSASNMNLALRITKWSHLPCFADTLNLIVQGAIAADYQVSSLQTKCKHIVSYFHRSVKASD
ncbi:PREDICTED: zinc finger BED domain-containing protein 1-like [Amphimedon queenslandica]|uniref:BED-type domain-containing protein n=2 Tax=Amphimedon queenslandica TaxID=400682 RepID=A0A1X7V408_AMPQE|nr:PREDICTED: zinc finger BED domain-containing protein 1-like [Amphimedon queenslandica]|eukprot:XP_011403270.1 PREDICTED: zinc finger BED domain-containing protein 1-like [Amphimedon queenslandica]